MPRFKGNRCGTNVILTSSPATADKIYRKALEKIRKELLKSGIVETNIPLKNIWNL